VNRAELLARVADRGERWDVLVIGGGATGLGAALDAVTRGYRTLLLERGDFACATSSRSTKLIHGGVRYLRQGNLALVCESLRERELLLRNAPELVKPLAFVVPGYRWWEKPYYAIGLGLYGLLSGGTLPRPQMLSREKTLAHLPSLNPQNLRGGELYYDAQFDDARLAIAVMQAIAERGGVPLNYVRVSSLLKQNERICGVRAVDLESGTENEIEARVVINATGVFSDSVRRLDDSNAPQMLAPSQGAHIVLPASFLPGDAALMIPRTDDGRVLFAIPWLGRLLVGTTDTPVREIAPEPRPLDSEIDFLLEHITRYFTKNPTRADVLSVFAGLRPLVKNVETQQTSKLARDHVIEISRSGLVTITGGKWTTFRKMGEDAIDAAAKVGELEKRASGTKNVRLNNRCNTEQSELLHAGLPYRSGDVLFAARCEMARTVEDVLARRTRALFLDAKASIEMAPRVARLLASELARDENWECQQVRALTELARDYLPP